jgi:hypothetical protein
MEWFHRQNYEGNETKMATRKGQLQVVEGIVEEAPAPEQIDIQALMAQKKALEEQIKALKATRPERNSLDAVMHRQTTSYEAWVPKMLANRIKARVSAGQDRQAAADQVVAFFRNLADERIDHEETEEAEARAVEIQEESND